ncbi:MAG: peptide deformylase [Gammaproteobacteria bacterium]|nr:peptide deformylase [Gammaproteobacteria bacterium]
MTNLNAAPFSIRCIGDAVLFAPTTLVQFTPEENIEGCLKKMTQSLHDHCGVGIAANQCADIPSPVPSIIIINPVNPQTRITAKVRYPNEIVPETEILINPVIIERSSETHCPGEGCLSIPCPFRGKVRRHRWIVVQYYDVHGNKHEKKHSDMTAQIIQHETEHLQGILFLHKLLQELNPSQKEHFIELIDEVINHPRSLENLPTSPYFAFDRDENGGLLIKEDYIIHALSQLDPTLLQTIRSTTLKSG